MSYLSRAKHIARTLGFRPAAGYLRNLGVSFETAHRALLGCSPRFA